MVLIRLDDLIEVVLGVKDVIRHEIVEGGRLVPWDAGLLRLSSSLIFWSLGAKLLIALRSSWMYSGLGPDPGENVGPRIEISRRETIVAIVVYGSLCSTGRALLFLINQ